MAELDPISEVGNVVSDFVCAIFLLFIAPFLPDTKI
jgi:hypothetical protein